MEYLNTLQHHPLPFQNLFWACPPEPKQVGNQLHVPKHLPQVKAVLSIEPNWVWPIGYAPQLGITAK